MTLEQAIKIRQRQLSDYSGHHPLLQEAVETIKIEVPKEIAAFEEKRLSNRRSK